VHGSRAPTPGPPPLAKRRLGATFGMAVERKCITLVCVRFVWDPKKARSNEQKHGVSFEEAVTSFADPLAIITDDIVRPERAILIGMSWKTRVLVTVFIEKSEDEIRLISSRLATRPERRRYEEGE
jgi:uncharacterized DUF497 family protein